MTNVIKAQSLLRLQVIPLILFIMSATLPVPLNAFADHQSTFNVQPEHVAPAGIPVPNSTRSFWFTDPDVSPLPNHGSDGPLTEDADICIIGSGITGVSAAYHLAKAFAEGDIARGLGRPVKAVILEARAFCKQREVNCHPPILTSLM